MTPEGKVKKRVTLLLREYGPTLWFNMPVPSVYGASTLDYIGCDHGRFFAIETKKPGGKPTPLQKNTIAAILAAGGTVFVVDGEAGLDALREWLINDTRKQG